MSASARKALSLLPTRTRSETTISHPNDTSPLQKKHEESDDEESEGEEEADQGGSEISPSFDEVS